VSRNEALLLVLVFLMFSCLVTVKPACSSDSPAENSWVTKASMNQARAYLGVATVNRKIYAIGGDITGITGNVIYGTVRSYRLVNTTEEYDPSNDSWTVKASMPTARALFGTAVYLNKIYCIGGYYTNVGEYNASYGPELNITYHDSAANEVYDPATNTWETKKPMPEPMLCVGANTVGDKIYVVGNSNVIYIYDPALDSWTLGTKSPNDIIGCASAVAGDKIYYIGVVRNSSGSMRGTCVQTYDTVNDGWSSLASSPTSIYSNDECGITSGIFAPQQIYFFEEKANHVYDITSNSWSNATVMPSARICAGVAEINDTFYVVGGRSGQWGYITMEFPSAVTEQYVPVGYGNICPTVSVVSPENKTYNESSVPLTFTVDKPVSLTEYSLDAQNNVSVAGNTTLTDLPNGVHNITMYAKYIEGSIGASENVKFTIQVLEPFPTTLVITASGVSVAVVAACMLVYFRKRKRGQPI
jgi:N-acetylneuraminic acid mutarotase